MKLPANKKYLYVGKASDLKNAKERALYRLFEFFPGFLAWTTLIGMAFLSWLRPAWTAYFIIIFCSYWLLRTIHFSVHLVAAYKKMKVNLNIDWIKELEKLPATKWRDVWHLIVLPMYKEDLKVVKSSFESLAKSDYPKDRMIVVLALEERAGEQAKEVADKIFKKYGKEFFRLLVTVHPADIQGEIAGKGSNETWAGKKAKQEIIDPLKIPYGNIIVSCFDIDTQVYPKYFSCLAYHFLTSSKPFRSSFQPIPLYMNNYWEAPFFSRVVASSNVFWQMMQQQRPEKIVTYSSHSMSFEALAEMDFWQTNVVSEDAGIFWKAFIFYDGDYKVVPLHYPLSMDSCVAETFWKTAKNQYKQQRRWAWGSEGIPYLLFGMVKNKKLPFRKGFTYLFLATEGFWAWATNALLILCLGWLPLILGGHEFQSTVLAYNLPVVTRNLMTLALVGLFTGVAINDLLSKQYPVYYTAKKKVFTFLQWIFFPLALIFFGALPAIDAQTRLMFGKYMGFWVTPKSRR